MKTYTAKTTVRLAEGVLSLTPEQAAIRSHALEPVGDGLYLLTGPVDFKAGETFGHDLGMPKAIAQCLEEMDEAQNLEDLDPLQLKAFANTIEAKFHPNAGKAKLIEAIKLRQDEMLAEQEAAEEAARVKAERIAELEALPERTAEQQTELDGLKA